MALSYKPVDRDQGFLLPPSMREWLADDDPVWFIIEAVERMDTSGFHRLARLGGVGRQGFDPDMLVTLFVYAMAHGTASSRRIERLCRTDVAFRIICAGRIPDHTVLARFRQRHGPQLEELLTESLVLAARLGMASLGVVALDGTKIAANAAADASRSEETLHQMAADWVERTRVTDAAEDARDDGSGPGLPAHLRDRTDRARRLDEAIAVIEERKRAVAADQDDRQARIAAYLADVAAGVARRGRPPAGADLMEVARARWEQARRAAQQRWDRFQAALAAGQHPMGRPRPVDEHWRVKATWKAYQEALAARDAQAGQGPDGQAPGTRTASHRARSSGFRANTTDPDSRLLPTRAGWCQGYNCQTAVSDDGFLLEARATQDANDAPHFITTTEAVTEMVATLCRRAGRRDLRVGLVLADAGYDSVENLEWDGPERLIPDARRHRLEQRAADEPAAGPLPEDASPRQKMTHRLRTPEGMAAYRRRAPMIESTNAWIKDGRGLRRFSRRGLDAVQSELCLAAAATNLLKILSRGFTTADLQALG